MEEKKTTKISLSTFFLILAIIAICVMGYFIYKLNDDKTKATEQVSDLNNRVTLLESSNNDTQETIIEKTNTNTEIEKNNSESVVDNTTSAYSYENISGYFTFNEKIPVNYGTYTSDTEAHKYLYLYENGMYFYDSGLGTANSVEYGNYVIKDNNIILHQWFAETSYKDGKGLYLNKDIHISDAGYKFTINSLDNISSELGFTNYPNVVMKRETNSELVKDATNKYEERLKKDKLYNYSNTDMYTQPGQGQ